MITKRSSGHPDDYALARGRTFRILVGIWGDSELIPCECAMSIALGDPTAVLDAVPSSFAAKISDAPIDRQRVYFLPPDILYRSPAFATYRAKPVHRLH